MKFKETETKEIGCSIGKCEKKHLSCCITCPDSEGCTNKCTLFILHEKQPSLLGERSCSYLEDAKTLVFKALTGRENIL